MKTKDLIICAMMAAVICVCSVINVPMGMISVTLSVLGVLLAGTALGLKRGTAAAAVYVLLGVIGIPVFGGMGISGGLGYIMGPTGGYVYSYIFMAAIAGFASDRLYNIKNKALALILMFSACIAGVAVCYALGTAQFMLVMHRNLKETLAICVIPFIPFDAAKSAVAAVLGLKLRKLIK